MRIFIHDLIIYAFLWHADIRYPPKKLPCFVPEEAEYSKGGQNIAKGGRRTCLLQHEAWKFFWDNKYMHAREKCMDNKIMYRYSNAKVGAKKIVKQIGRNRNLGIEACCL